MDAGQSLQWAGSYLELRDAGTKNTQDSLFYEDFSKSILVNVCAVGLQNMVKTFEVCDLPVRSAKFVTRKS